MIQQRVVRHSLGLSFLRRVTTDLVWAPSQIIMEKDTITHIFLTVVIYAVTVHNYAVHKGYLLGEQYATVLGI